MTLLERLRRAAGRLLRSGDPDKHSRRSNPVPATSQPPPHENERGTRTREHDARAFGSVGLAGEESIGAMSAGELSAWENRGIPSIDRVSDEFESRADEKQDVTTSLNFPLHWTTARESWDYLFEFSVASTSSISNLPRPSRSVKSGECSSRADAPCFRSRAPRTPRSCCPHFGCGRRASSRNPFHFPRSAGWRWTPVSRACG